MIEATPATAVEERDLDEQALQERAPNLAPPPGNPRFPLFDAMRAIAALSVFVGHTITQLYPYATGHARFDWAAAVADQGVAIFFLISGFLLYRPFLVASMGGRPVRVPAYAKRRFLRIVPAYWVALTIVIALGFVSGVSTGNWWRFYGFGQIYSANTIGNGIGVAWTLCVEVTFYALLPLFVFVAARLRAGRRGFAPDIVLLVVLAAASLAWRAHYSSFFDVDKVFTLAGTFFWFALGMALAIASVVFANRRPPLRLDGRLRGVWPAISWALAALVFVALEEIRVHPTTLGDGATSVLVHMLYGFAALLILAPAVFDESHGGAVRGLLRLRPLVWIGLVSYGFYLYHTIVIARLARGITGTGWRYVAVASAALVLSLACAAVSYYALERPVMLLGRSRGGVRKRARVTP